MIDELKWGLTKLLNRHYSAVQCDTELGLCNNDDKYVSLERKAKNFWKDFEDEKKRFEALLEK